MKIPLWSKALGIIIGFLLGAGVTYAAVQYCYEVEVPASVVVVEVEDWDVTCDDQVNVLDMIRVGQQWGETGEPHWIREDVNSEGDITVLDMIVIGLHWTG